jgi:hypothetical protein
MALHRLSGLAALALIAGCGTVSSTRIDVAAVRPATFEIQDQRPVDARGSFRSSESFGEMIRLGDDAITPPGPELLKAWVADKLGDRLAGKTIVLTDFSVQIVDPAVTIDEQAFNTAMASTPGANALSGLMSRWLIGGIESVRTDKTVGVSIAGSLDGAGFTGRGGGSFKGRVSEANINSVILQALDNAVAEIERLPAGAQRP